MSLRGFNEPLFPIQHISSPEAVAQIVKTFAPSMEHGNSSPYSQLSTNGTYREPD